MTKKEANKKMKELFNLKTEISEKNAKKKELEESLANYADKHQADFDDGDMALEYGLIKVKLGQPKMIWEKSQKAVSTKDRALFCEELDSKYVKKAPDMTKMVALVNGDKNLKNFLKAKDVAVTQDTGYDYKAY